MIGLPKLQLKLYEAYIGLPTPGASIFRQYLTNTFSKVNNWFAAEPPGSWLVPLELKTGISLVPPGAFELQAGQLTLLFGGIQSGKTQILIKAWRQLDTSGVFGAFIDGHFALSGADFRAIHNKLGPALVGRPPNLQAASQMAQLLLTKSQGRALFIDGIFDLPLQSEGFREIPVSQNQRVAAVQLCCRQLLRLAQDTQAVVLVSCCDWTEESVLGPVVTKYADRCYKLSVI